MEFLGQSFHLSHGIPVNQLHFNFTICKSSVHLSHPFHFIVQCTWANQCRINDGLNSQPGGNDVSGKEVWEQPGGDTVPGSLRIDCSLFYSAPLEISQPPAISKKSADMTNTSSTNFITITPTSISIWWCLWWFKPAIMISASSFASLPKLIIVIQIWKAHPPKPFGISAH